MGTNSVRCEVVPYGWHAFYPHVMEPWPTFPMVGYFLETEASLNGDWPCMRSTTLLSFWLGADGVPESMQTVG